MIEGPFEIANLQCWQKWVSPTFFYINFSLPELTSILSPKYVYNSFLFKDFKKIIVLGLQQNWEEGSEVSLTQLMHSENVVTQSCPTLCDPMDYSPQAPRSMGFSMHEYWSGLLFPSPGESSWPRDQTRVSCIVGRCFTVWATRDLPHYQHHSSEYFFPRDKPTLIHQSYQKFTVYSFTVHSLGFVINILCSIGFNKCIHYIPIIISYLSFFIALKFSVLCLFISLLLCTCFWKPLIFLLSP